MRQEAEEEYRLKEFLERQERTRMKLEKHEKSKVKALSQRTKKNE